MRETTYPPKKKTSKNQSASCRLPNNPFFSHCDFNFDFELRRQTIFCPSAFWLFRRLPSALCCLPSVALCSGAYIKHSNRFNRLPKNMFGKNVSNLDFKLLRQRAHSPSAFLFISRKRRAKGSRSDGSKSQFVQGWQKYQFVQG